MRRLCSSTVAMGEGYDRIDPQVAGTAWRSRRTDDRDDPRPRARRVAELLWRYVEAMQCVPAAPSLDPMLSESINIQRWVGIGLSGSRQAPARRLPTSARAVPITRPPWPCGSGGVYLGRSNFHLPISRTCWPMHVDWMCSSVATSKGGAELLETLADSEIRVGRHRADVAGRIAAPAPGRADILRPAKRRLTTKRS